MGVIMVNDGFQRLEELMDYFNKNGGRSFERINELKNTSALDIAIETNNLHTYIKNVILDFINILDDPSLEKYPYTKKIKIYNLELFKLFNMYGYELSAYFNNTKAYRNFPLFIQSAANKFGIKKYADMPIDELDKLLNQYVDLVHQININTHRYEVLVMLRYFDNKDKYNKYEDKKMKNKLDLNDIDDLFIASEDHTYILENSLLYNTNTRASWVARYFGDGYGYDILSYDRDTLKEKLIEVKSGYGNNFKLTKNEHKTMVEANNNDNCEYYIYKYTRNAINNNIYLTIYKYDKEKDLLVDINNPNNVCLLTPNQYFTDDHGRVVEFYATNENLLTRKRQ